ncbi:pyridoxal phosphate-dependent aminotransferase [Croceicoccus hydrothermalis]|uniref:pyridoxal phosphate-dependent aminotransferase n=1 Tax=Croceicoccus hydrothermalis TaxID=2867964 RepID=UPI001EFBB97B|nr:pyridoxal phosphate-dependent aminotransferase [Croceicoccus hydrothermalis]
MISRLRPPQSLLVGLFESSVPEPVELLSRMVGAGFGEEITSRYQSAFVGGNPYVTAALARDYEVDENAIVTTTGATGALSLVYRALMKPGERVLIENPGFDLFAILAETQGFGVDRFERVGPRFAVDPDRVEAALRPETRVIVVSNLHNPSGFELGEDELRALAALAERRDLTVIVDEVYLPYAGVDAAAAATKRISPRLISINSLTKIYGLSSLRCGWIIGDPEVMNPIRALSDEIEFSISKLSHAVAALVLEKPEAMRERTDAIIARARPIIESYHHIWQGEGLVDSVLPEHGCIVFPRLIGIEDTRAFSEWLAQRGGVVVAPGEYFGSPGHIRIGFGIEAARLDYGLQALTDGMTKFRDIESSRKHTAIGA